MAKVALAEQEKCSHELVFVHETHEEMRICPRCGREEHAPFYHTFLFTALRGKEYIMVDWKRFNSARVEGTEIIRHGRGS